jgi:hypothetical protein
MRLWESAKTYLHEPPGRPWREEAERKLGDAIQEGRELLRRRAEGMKQR